MDTQELLVHNRGQGQGAERLHAGVVDRLRVLVFAFQLEREVVGQVAAFVVPPKEEQAFRIPDLQRPQV